MKDIFILGGPNGAGKTTAARTLLPNMLNVTAFVNADEIAREMSPSDVDRAALAAGRAMIEEMHRHIRDERSFAFETTCAAKSHIRLLEECRASGWTVTLIYLWLRSPAVAMERVSQRVREGGHNIPSDVIARRYATGLLNMRTRYLPACDFATIYDSTDGLVLIARRSPPDGFVIYDHNRWALIESMST